MPARTKRWPHGQRSPSATRGKQGRRAENKTATQAQIVRAALALFQSKGFDATTTKSIAQKAGIAEGTVFNYFRTKHDIALHFFEHEVEAAMTEVRSNPRLRTAPLEEKLFALIQRQLALLAPYERFIGSAVIEAMKPSSKLGPFGHRANALRHRYMAFVQDLMEESLPKKSIVPVAWWAPEAFWVFYMAALLFWLNDTSPRKEHTLAFLDRSLKIGVAVLTRAS